MRPPNKNCVFQNGHWVEILPGCERVEQFTLNRHPAPKTFVQYDYRHPDGDLFSCVARTVGEARTYRDRWIINRKEARQ